MGLDMYLTARKSSYKPFGDNDVVDPERQAMVAAADVLGLPYADNIDHIAIEREVGYWRKANQIHAYFVTNHQDGRDECQPSRHMDRDDLQRLRDLCAELLVNKSDKEAMEKLPPQGGFFFGGTELDEWYWEDLANTIVILDRAIAIPGNVDFIYQSSW